MKKAALLLAVILLTVTLWVVLTLRHLGPIEAAQLVPNTTLALVDLPDLAATSHRWKELGIAQLASEPEIKTLFERSLNNFHQWTTPLVEVPPAEPIENLIVKLQPGRAFIALEPFAESTDWIIGCQFFGKKNTAEAALLRIHQLLDTHLGTGDQITLDIKETHGEIITRSLHGSFALYSVIHGNWCFVSSSPEPLQKSLNFLIGRSAKKESLAATELYKKDHERGAKESEIFCFALPHRIAEHLVTIPLVMGKNSTIASLESLEFSLRFVREKIEETLFLQGTFPSQNASMHEALAYTSPTSVGYLEWSADWKKLATQLQNGNQFFAAIGQFLSASGFDLSLVAEFLKPEAAAVLNWPAAHPIPQFLFSMPLLNSAQATEWIEALTLNLHKDIQTSAIQGIRSVVLDRRNLMLQPTLVLTPKTLFVGSAPSIIEQVQQVETNVPSDNQTLAAAPGFQKIISLYHKPHEVFGYLSTREIFEHLYGSIRLSLMMGGSFMPGTNISIDTSKLPKTETVSKYLSPIVYAQHHEQDGLLIQTEGPFGLVPLFLSGSMISAIMKNSMPFQRKDNS